MNSYSISQAMWRKGWEMFIDQAPEFEPMTPSDPEYWKPENWEICPRSEWVDRPVIYGFSNLDWNFLRVGKTHNLWKTIRDRYLGQRYLTDGPKGKIWDWEKVAMVYYLEYDGFYEDFFIESCEQWLIEALDPVFNIQHRFPKIPEYKKMIQEELRRFRNFCNGC